MVCHIINATEITFSVDGFTSATMSLKDIRVVAVALACNCPVTQTTFILFFHQVLHVPTTKKHLVNLQMREHGIVVNYIHLSP
jgi:hypothetical protein